ncbi:MAG: hypothetical protein WCB27_12380 [Thermoguttaceae bacterium]
MMNWLNANQGAALVILTLGYVLATVVMVSVMIHSNRLTRQLDEQRSRPAATFCILRDAQWIYAVLANTGVTPAYDVRVTCDPALTRCGNGTESAITAHPTSFLPAKEKITDFIDAGHTFFERFTNPVFNCAVCYTDKAGKRYEENFRLDLTVLSDCNYDLETDLEKELKNIGKQLEKMCGALASRG